MEELKIVEQKYLDNIFANENYNDYYYNLSKGAYGGDNLTNNPNKEEIIEKIKMATKISTSPEPFCKFSLPI